MSHTNKRLMIPDDMYAALEKIAESEYRDINNQLLYILSLYVRKSDVLAATIAKSEPEPVKPTEMVVTKNRPEPQPEPQPEDGNLQRALTADALENSEERAKAQAQAVLAAWKALFPAARNLAYTRAISWIQQRWDSAAEVVEVFLSVKERVDAGRAQVMPAFDNYVAAAIPPKEPRKPRTTQQVTNDAGWVMRPQTPEEEAEDARTQQIAIQNGWWKPEDLEGLV